MKRVLTALVFVLSFSASAAIAATYPTYYGVIEASDHAVDKVTYCYNVPCLFNLSQSNQGVDGYGFAFTDSAQVGGGFGGGFASTISEYVSSSLSNGQSGWAPDPYQSWAQVQAYLFVGFIVPNGVYGISFSESADGHGLSTIGGATVSGSASAGIGGGGCTIFLTGGQQSCVSGEIAVQPGDFETFRTGAGMNAVSYGNGESASLNYWGTFTDTVDFYDANGNVIAQYGPPTDATPEPSSFLLFGSGLVGLGGMIRRKLKA